jgi:5-formyltetrahydrofolate cyclo-ligase
MAARNPSDPPKKRGRPAHSPEEREKQLQNLAYDEAERLITEHKASSQVLTHFLKGGSEREQLEMERLRNDNRLLLARIEQMEAAVRAEASIEAALEAFRSYQSNSGDDPDD